jgi:hypothetical protein
MKFVVLGFFVLAFTGSIICSETKERNFSSGQRMLLVSGTWLAWAFVLVLGFIAV